MAHVVLDIRDRCGGDCGGNISAPPSPLTKDSRLSLRVPAQSLVEELMKNSAHLTTASLVSILLLTLHLTHDIVLGISKAEPSNLTAVAIFVVLLYGTLMLAERRSGYVIMLLGGIIAAGMPALHMSAARFPERAASSGGFFFVWTLFALGVTGVFSVILSARGLWSLRRGQPR